MTDTNSPQYTEALNAYKKKKDQYDAELEISTNFHELRKALFLADYLNPHDGEDDMQYEYLSEAQFAANQKVLELCKEFAHKTVSLEVAKEEWEKADKVLENVRKEVA
tara:strand:+ start:308 stop:631 length:324 start_codon:yes stop_codon:yes gene_type:complete